MRNMLSRKLKSCGGASLTVALLLFMVCAVVGIVVLTAATTAGGRAKDLTEVDRSYYNVASAVSLLSKELCGRDIKVKINRMIETIPADEPDGTPEYNYITEIREVKINETGETEAELQHTFDSPACPLGLINGEIQSNQGEQWSFLTWMAVCLLFDNSNDGSGTIFCNTDAAMNYYFDDSVLDDEDNREYITKGNFVLAPAGAGLPEIKCEYKLKKDGVLLLEVTDNTPVLGLKNYTLTLKLRPEFKDTGILKNSDKGLSQRTSTVTWKVDSVS